MFFGCTTLVAVIAWRTFGKAPVGIEPPFLSVFILIGIASLVWLLPQFKCLRERIIIAVWAGSLGIDLLAELALLGTKTNDGPIGVAVLVAWFVAVIVSASMLGS
jgi:hypothetical protein